jgi:hypothetical protein
MGRILLGWSLGCAATSVVISVGESHSWRQTLMLAVGAPVMIPFLLCWILFDSITRRDP